MHCKNLKRTEREKIDNAKFEQMIRVQRRIDGDDFILRDNILDIQNLLVSLIGNKRINHEINRFGPRILKAPGYYLRFFHAFTYRTRYYSQIENSMDEIYKQFKLGKNKGKKLKDNEKISLKQYGILWDFAAVYPIVKSFYQHDLIVNNNKLENLYKHIQYALEIIESLDKEFIKFFKFPVGSVTFQNRQLYAEVRNKEKRRHGFKGFFKALYHFLASRLIRFDHAALGFFETTKNQTADIYPYFQIRNFELRDFLYNQVYKINLEQLISDDNKNLLRKTLGENWLDDLKDKYNELFLQAQDIIQDKHVGLTVKQGFSEIIRTIQIAFAFLLGYKNWFVKDHSNEDVRDNLFRKGKWKDQKEGAMLICSEFIGILLIAIIQELNDEIKKDLQDRGVERIPKKIIKSPLSEKENLKLLTPDRLLKALKERNAIEQVSFFIPSIDSVVFSSERIFAQSSIDEEQKQNGLQVPLAAMGPCY